MEDKLIYIVLFDYRQHIEQCLQLSNQLIQHTYELNYQHNSLQGNRKDQLNIF